MPLELSVTLAVVIDDQVDVVALPPPAPLSKLALGWASSSSSGSLGSGVGDAGLVSVPVAALAVVAACSLGMPALQAASDTATARGRNSHPFDAPAVLVPDIGSETTVGSGVPA